MKRRRTRLPQTPTARLPHGPTHPLPPIDDFVGNKILLLSNLVGRSATLRYRRLVGLPHVRWRIIALLGAQPPMTLQELVARAGLDKSQLSRELSSLVRQQFVSRRRSAEDRRLVRLELTERGVGVYAVLVSGAHQRSERLLAGLSKERRRMLLEQLDMLIVRAREMLQGEERTSQS